VASGNNRRGGNKQMTDRLRTLQRRVGKIKTQFLHAKETAEKERERLKQSKARSLDIKSAIDITQKVSQTLQQQAHTKITRVVTACLQSVFYDEDYGLKILFERKRSKTEAKLVLIKEGHIIEDPMEEDSGGVVDVAAFVLRLSCLMLSKPAVRRIIVLDEPFKFVSIEYRDNVRMMLEKLSSDFDIQFIMVTHIEELVTGKEVQL
jgi:DNA repair exonuclease SbcCD ATPase subunit